MGKRGFTLVELMIVIGICGLMLSFSLPSLSRFKNSLLLDATSQAFASQLRAAQVKAMSSGATQAVERFEFSKSGSSMPGGSGTKVFEDKFGFSRRVILSSAGRVRIE